MLSSGFGAWLRMTAASVGAPLAVVDVEATDALRDRDVAACAGRRDVGGFTAGAAVENTGSSPGGGDGSPWGADAVGDLGSVMATVAEAVAAAAGVAAFDPERVRGGGAVGGFVGTAGAGAGALGVALAARPGAVAPLWALLCPRFAAPDARRPAFRNAATAVATVVASTSPLLGGRGSL